MELIFTLVFIFGMVFMYFDVEKYMNQIGKLSKENKILDKRLSIMINILDKQPNISEDELKIKIKERWNKINRSRTFNRKKKYFYIQLYKKDIDRSLKIGEDISHLISRIIITVLFKYLTPVVLTLIIISLIYEEI